MKKDIYPNTKTARRLLNDRPTPPIENLARRTGNHQTSEVLGSGGAPGYADLKIISKNNKPYGIRDTGGFLFFFTEVSKFQGQEERYRLEVGEQYKLADFLLAALKKA